MQIKMLIPYYCSLKFPEITIPIGTAAASIVVVVIFVVAEVILGASVSSTLLCLMLQRCCYRYRCYPRRYHCGHGCGSAYCSVITLRATEIKCPHSGN